MALTNCFLMEGAWRLAFSVLEVTRRDLDKRLRQVSSRASNRRRRMIDANEGDHSIIP